MEPTIKPGTRCECRAIHEAVDPHKEWIHGTGKCENDAVRMVTVRKVKSDGMGGHTTEVSVFPMCSACADWAEDAENARMTGQFDAPEGGAR